MIDLENIQPDNLNMLVKHNFKVMVFVGANQAKVTFEMAAALQVLGERAEYIKISGNGPDALDFHIAYYIGHIAATTPNSYFHIISKDTGFDPLIQHLKQRKIMAGRHRDIAHIPLLKAIPATSLEDRIKTAVEFLHARAQARPGTMSALSNSINNLFRNTLNPQQISSLITHLRKLNYIKEENNKIVYQLPEKTKCEAI